MSRQSDRRIPIRILNPLGDSQHTSLFNAKRYVMKGLAQWVGPAIEFTRNPNDHRDASAQRTLEIGYDRAAGTGLARKEAVRHLPVAGAPINVFVDRANDPRRAARGRCGPVKIIVRDGVMVKEAA